MSKECIYFRVIKAAKLVIYFLVFVVGFAGMQWERFKEGTEENEETEGIEGTWEAQDLCLLKYTDNKKALNVNLFGAFLF